MKNRKVLNLRTHIGGLHGKTSYDAKQDQADMEVTPVGVLVKSVRSGECNLLVPFSNIVEVKLGPEEEDKPKK